VVFFGVLIYLCKKNMKKIYLFLFCAVLTSCEPDIKSDTKDVRIITEPAPSKQEPPKPKITVEVVPPWFTSSDNGFVSRKAVFVKVSRCNKEDLDYICQVLSADERFQEETVNYDFKLFLNEDPVLTNVFQEVVRQNKSLNDWLMKKNKSFCGALFKTASRSTEGADLGTSKCFSTLWINPETGKPE
jgi:hypothetical protein